MCKKKNRKRSKAELEKVPSVSYFKLFRYASRCDKVLIFVALTSSMIAGFMVPMSINLSANIFRELIEYEKSTVEKGKQIKTDQDLSNKLNEFSVKYILVAIVLLVGGYLGAAFMNTTAINQIFRIRKEYLTAALNQDMSYFDSQQTKEFASKTSQDLIKLEEGINEKLSSLVYLTTAALSCISLALFKGWKLALIYLSSTPVSMLLVGVVGKLASKQAKKEAKASSKAGGAAEETLGAIRTVYSYNGQQKEIERYEKCVAEARKIDIRKEQLQGLTISLLHLVVFCTYGIGFYIGVYLVVHDPQNYNAGTMFEVFFGVITGMMYLGMIGTLVGAFGTARGAGSEVFALLDQKPTINPLLDRGLQPAAVTGDIVFKDVYFHYPSRPDVPILQGLSLTVRSGQSVALVGPSGSGKSTVLQLICRFYDVLQGQVLVDGVDVRSLNVRWLRRQVGLVGQEPVLFAGTVADNIRHGRATATTEDVEEAARLAFAHNFIMKLPKGYATMVGQRGTTISGGQKQRIAIARALVRHPRLLLLDEATSALDPASEHVVQAALDRVSKGRTTLTVAHRLLTIRNVDYIYVLDKGRLVEQGSHKELMKQRGVYYRLAKMQGVPDEYPEADVERKSIVSMTNDDEIKAVVEREEAAETKKVPVSLWCVLRLNAAEWRWIVLGSVSSVLLGLALPIYTVAFGKLFGAIAEPDVEETMRSVVMVALVFVGMGVLFAVINIIESASFGIAGAHLTQRLRVRMFRQLLMQDVQYFDDEANSTGALCARLAAETARVRQGTGQRVGAVLQGLGAVSIGIVLTFAYVWQAGALALCFVPFVTIILYFQIKSAKTESFGQAAALEKSTKIAIEAITNVRTVASLGREPGVVAEYVEQLRPALRPARRMAHFVGAVNGLAKALSVLATAVVLPFAARLMITDNVKVESVVTCTQALQLSLMSIQNAFTNLPEFQKAILAGSRVMALLNSKPAIVDADPPAVSPFNFQGEASLNNVNFRYPTRPNNQLLNGFDLKIEKNKTIALVGESGCGKSTVMNLLLRFYDPEKGTVKLEQYDVRELMVRDVRGSSSVVAQEPVLFDRSLRENIAYGDNERTHPDSDIQRAAEQANIHTFIQSLPEGYNTSAGSRGAQLSGGQKQRVAIARALLKNPRLLLLDEATSALDAESEKVVQESLSRARAGRTCVLVAHRLSAVRDADVICVVEGGRVAEAGSHDQLLAAGGKYSQMHADGT